MAFWLTDFVSELTVNYLMSISSNDCDEAHLWGQVDEEERDNGTCF